MHVLKTAVVGALACSSLAAADCYNSNDWTISFLNEDPAGYWAAVPNDSKKHDLTKAQCLYMLDESCKPCSEIKPDRIGVPNSFGSCKLYWNDKDNTKVSPDGEDVPGMYLYRVDPPKSVAAIKC